MADLVGVDVVARLLKIEPRRIQFLAKEGIIPKAARGRYDLVACVHGYLDYVREGQRDRATVVDMEELRKRKQLADTEIAELALEEARGLVVPIGVVIAEVEDCLLPIRVKLLAMKTRYSGRWAKISRAPAMAKAIEGAALEILDELTSGDDVARVAGAANKKSKTVRPAPKQRPAARRPRKTNAAS